MKNGLQRRTVVQKPFQCTATLSSEALFKRKQKKMNATIHATLKNNKIPEFTKKKLLYYDI